MFASNRTNGHILKNMLLSCFSLLIALVQTDPAKAEMVLDKVVVDMSKSGGQRQDIEVWNTGTDRIYVLSELSEILDPGSPIETRIPASDPEISSLFISPQKMILEEGERRIIRVVALGPRQEKDRVYRLMIKPVAGPVTAEATALKVFVGYDALVIYRPEEIVGKISASFDGSQLTLQNGTNTAQSLFEGRQCDEEGEECVELPSKRLYSGVTWVIDLPYRTKVTYRAQVGDKTSDLTFAPSE